MFYEINHPEIKAAFEDLRQLLVDSYQNIGKIMLFGSTMTIPIEEARDIDFFISFKNEDFDTLKSKLLKSNSIKRNIVIENLEASYSNCPKWNSDRPLTLHIILYREGVSQFSEKLLRTKSHAIDITNKILNDSF